jgi:hypothetical protein
LWFTNARVVFDGQSEPGSRVLNTLRTDPPGIANAKCPRDVMASRAAFSTMRCTADATSASVGRTWTLYAGGAARRRRRSDPVGATRALGGLEGTKASDDATIDEAPRRYTSRVAGRIVMIIY